MMTMNILTTVKEMSRWSRQTKHEHRRIAFVPTMGYLHQGHASLIRLARQQADDVVVSIFVNPTQFGPNEDLASYPRDFDRDEIICRQEGVSAIFYPTVAEMYPPDSTVFVNESNLSSHLCGATRPGHFRGVLTVVSKLFNIIQPDLAVFGRKDAQQLRLIQQMTRDLNFPVVIMPAPIIREPDGLAMSSRNARLTPEQRPHALCLRRALDRAEALYAQGCRDASALIQAMREIIEPTPHARLDYIECVDWDTLQPVPSIAAPSLLALAVFIGNIRLIDNTLLEPEPAE